MNNNLFTRILGFDVYSGGLDHLVSETIDLINKEGNGLFSVNAFNPHSYYLSKSDHFFRAALLQSSILLPDGVGVSIGGAVVGRSIKKLAAWDFFISLSSRLSKEFPGARVFFIGGCDEEALKKLMKKYSHEFQNLPVAGYSPPYKSYFDDEDLSEMADKLEEFCADVVWVGIGAPKQEKLISQLSKSSNVKVMAGVGAVFDFYTGDVQRAPSFLCNAGLEWLPRLIQEPRRLWRRSFVSAPVFLMDILKSKFM